MKIIRAHKVHSTRTNTRQEKDARLVFNMGEEYKEITQITDPILYSNTYELVSQLFQLMKYASNSSARNGLLRLIACTRGTAYRKHLKNKVTILCGYAFGHLADIFIII